MNINEVQLYSSEGVGTGGTVDSARVVVEGQEFLCRLIAGKITVVGEPSSPVKSWRKRAKDIARNRITKARADQRDSGS